MQKFLSYARAYRWLCQIKRIENGKSLFVRALSWTDNILIIGIALKVFNVQFNYWLLIGILPAAFLTFFVAGYLYEKKKVMHLEAEYGFRNNWLQQDQRKFQKEVRDFMAELRQRKE